MIAYTPKGKVMKALYATAAAVVVSIAAASTAFAMDYSQLAASAGLTPAQAQGLTLNEIALAKHNAELDRGEGIGTSVSASYVLSERDAGQVVASTRSGPAYLGNGAAYRQLIANAGLTQEQAMGLSLREIATAKFNRDTVADDRMGV